MEFPKSTIFSDYTSKKSLKNSNILTALVDWKLEACSESPMGVKQNPWTPTRRRGPIAAESSSPGPAFVSLPSLIGKPTPESRRPRAPAYTFGSKSTFGIASKSGPGPATYNTEGMTKKGRAFAPAASLHYRWPGLRLHTTPAPCDYESSKSAKAVLYTSPAFTFGVRVRPPKQLGTIPAPNEYNMPPVIGEAREGNKRAAPAFSMTGRGKYSTEPKTPLPGPGAYSTDNAGVALQKRPPAFTMAPRRQHKPPTAGVPGPGNYCPEKVCVNLPWSPAHTFGIRHSPFIGTAAPHLTPEDFGGIPC